MKAMAILKETTVACNCLLNPNRSISVSGLGTWNQAWSLSLLPGNWEEIMWWSLQFWQLPRNCPWSKSFVPTWGILWYRIQMIGVHEFFMFHARLLQWFLNSKTILTNLDVCRIVKFRNFFFIIKYYYLFFFHQIQYAQQ